MPRTATVNPATGLPTKVSEEPTLPQLPSELHKRGCPQTPNRTESYLAQRPPSQGRGKLLVIRCVDCGNAQYLDASTRRVADDIDPNQGGRMMGRLEVDSLGRTTDDDEMEIG